jgi:hypothetical protein
MGKMQASYRILATKKLRQLRASNHHNNVMAKRQTYILKNINNKLEKKNAMVARADKGRTCVIIHTDEYNKKSTTSLMRTTFKNYKKIPRTNTRNSLPNTTTQRPCYQQETKTVPHTEV